MASRLLAGWRAITPVTQHIRSARGTAARSGLPQPIRAISALRPAARTNDSQPEPETRVPIYTALEIYKVGARGDWSHGVPPPLGGRAGGGAVGRLPDCYELMRLWSSCVHTSCLHTGQGRDECQADPAAVGEGGQRHEA